MYNKRANEVHKYVLEGRYGRIRKMLRMVKRDRPL